MKRILVVADMHSGSRVGLTPPSYQYQLNSDDNDYYKYAVIQDKLWNWYKTKVEQVNTEKQVDIVLGNADLIDGKGSRSGGTEQITTDRNKQAEIATECIRIVGASEGRLTYGTAYHTGTDEDMEQRVADSLGWKIESHGKYDIEGVKIDMRHFVSSSIIPYGRYTSISREYLWRCIWEDRYQGSKPDILIRSHVHYFGFCGDADHICITTPALQGLGSKFGSRVCSGLVDFGFIVIDCHNGEYTWRPYTCLLQAESQSYETL